MDNHVVIDSTKQCYGCTACAAKCPCGAITMTTDEEGFLYPTVNAELCVDCGLCKGVCPALLGNRAEPTQNFCALTHHAEEIRTVSSSGGAFSAIAQYVLATGGKVYGAAYDEHFAVRHIRTGTTELHRLRGSKYVQSDLTGIFPQVRADLLAGKPVLFTGTPCQVDGLKCYLQGCDLTNLTTVDLICHGAPSPKIWREYLDLVESRKGKITAVNFRNKEGCGWRNSTLRIVGENGKILLDAPHSEGAYSRLYFNHLISRPICFTCPYASTKRCGDLSIGDHWAVERHRDGFDDDRGLSLVLANTAKGKKILGYLSRNCAVHILDEEQAMQPCLQAPPADFGFRDVFWKAYQAKGLAFACQYMGYERPSLRERFGIFHWKVKQKLSRLH